MSDMTPEQYRALAAEFERTLGRHPLPVELAVQSALRAAADESDQSAKWYEAAREEHAEVDHLRAVIENAPHAWDCTDPDGGSFCTCWKSDPL